MSLVDILVGSFLLTLVFVGVFGAFQLGFKVIGQGQREFVAINLANERMEDIKNLSYKDIGTVGAKLPYAEGVLSNSETISRNGVDYLVEVRVKYIADSADGLAAPEDSCPNDYKKVKVKASWEGLFGGEVELLTDISPPDLAAECAQKGGVLDISVFDAYGQMVASPLIEVKDAGTEEVVDSAVPGDGRHYFILSPDTYRVVVSKEGNSSARTYGDDEIAEPDKPDPEIGEGERVELSFGIDEVGGFSVETLTTVETEEGEQVVAVADVEFMLEGEKTIGKDEEGDFVYKYSETHITDSSGIRGLQDMEWDNYNFSVDPSTGLILEETDLSPQPVSLAPGEQKIVKLYVSSENSLLLKVLEQETGEPVFSANVSLWNNSLGYNETKTTNQDGRVYFLPLEEATYDLEVDAQDYDLFTDQVTVLGNASTTVEIERIE